MAPNNPDGKYVVIRKSDGVRISGVLHESEASARQEIQRLTESVGQNAPPEFEVKQFLLG